MSGNWQRRWHPLLSQWVLISATSAKRPWSGATSTANPESKLAHDPDCYLCPGVTRANGQKTPDYAEPFAFDNDFPSLSFKADDVNVPGVDGSSPLTMTAPAHGTCRVLCWSPRHDVTLANISADCMLKVVRLWQTEYKSLAADPNIKNVLIFENKGKEMGVSNLHPHGQIYATSFLSDTAIRMRAAQTKYAQSHTGESLLQAILEDAHTTAELLIDKGQYFSIIVPFAARFAYETWIVPHRKLASVADMTDAEIEELAKLYQTQARRYDLLFERSAPNITLLHNAPCDEDIQNENWCFHLAFQPPLRDANKLKYLAGFESGSNNIVNPVQPEHAARVLRDINPKATPS